MLLLPPPNDDPDVVLYVTDIGEQIFLDFYANPRAQPFDSLAELLQRPGIQVSCVTEVLGKPLEK